MVRPHHTREECLTKLSNETYANSNTVRPAHSHRPWSVDGDAKLHPHLSRHHPVARMAGRCTVRRFHRGHPARRSACRWWRLPCCARHQIPKSCGLTIGLQWMPAQELCLDSGVILPGTTEAER